MCGRGRGSVAMVLDAVFVLVFRVLFSLSLSSYKTLVWGDSDDDVYDNDILDTRCVGRR